MDFPVNADGWKSCRSAYHRVLCCVLGCVPGPCLYWGAWLSRHQGLFQAPPCRQSTCSKPPSRPSPETVRVRWATAAEAWLSAHWGRIPKPGAVVAHSSRCDKMRARRRQAMRAWHQTSLSVSEMRWFTEIDIEQKDDCHSWQKDLVSCCTHHDDGAYFRLGNVSIYFPSCHVLFYIVLTLLLLDP